MSDSSWDAASNIAIAEGYSTEIGFGIDATGVGSTNISAGTDLLNEIKVVASGNEA